MRLISAWAAMAIGVSVVQYAKQTRGLFGKIIITGTLQDRIDTLAHVREPGIKVCCGDIIGMGERVVDRLGYSSYSLIFLPIPKASDQPVERSNGSSRSDRNGVSGRDGPDLLPKSVVPLSAGRQYMTDELRALSFWSARIRPYRLCTADHEKPTA